MKFGAALREAIGYFTILPAGATPGGPPSPEAVALLPLTGIAIGALSGLLARGTAAIAPAPLASAAGYVLPILLTGALHVDGFLDVCDALFAQVTPERRREILRDPHHGTFAVAAQSIAAVIGYASVASLPSARLPYALAFAEGAGRIAALLVALDAQHAAGTAGAAFEERPDERLLTAQAALVFGLALLAGGKRLAFGAVVVAVAARIGARPLARAFGGRLGGDAYGFTIVTAQLASLALAAATASNERD